MDDIETIITGSEREDISDAMRRGDLATLIALLADLQTDTSPQLFPY